MERVNINSIAMIGENERGVTYAATAESRDDFLIIHRNADTLNGCHYHKGSVEHKNPEILYMIKGEANLYCYDLISGEEENFTLKSYTHVEIYPYVWHELKAKSDIIFLEMNALEAHQKDTFYNLENLDLNQ